MALQASRLISVSDVEGIYLDVDNPSSHVSQVTAGEARAFLEEGRLTDGMVPKVETALGVLEKVGDDSEGHFLPAIGGGADRRWATQR